jgi:hypothetical protein
MNQPALPSYLQNRQSHRVAEGAANGIGGSLPPHISIRGNEFTLVDASGNKAEVPDKFLDGCFVDRSEVVCKQFYEEDYVDGADDPPACWSSNGIGPSIESAKPQSTRCDICQWNIRGSDVSKLSGKAIKACRDEKWTAFIPIKYPTMIFQLKITPGSFKTWKAYTDKFKGQATDLSDVVTRLQFEKGKNGVLTFEAVSYIDEGLFKSREAAVAEKKTDTLVGRNDRPIQAALAAPSSASAPSGASAPQEAPPLPTGAFSPPSAPTGSPAPFGAAPSAATPLTATATPAPSTMGGQPAPAASPSEPTGRRRRRTKAEMEAANAPAQPNGGPAPEQGFAPVPAPQAAPFRPAAAPQAAPFGIATQAVAPDPAMSGMLDNIFGRSGGAA